MLNKKDNDESNKDKNEDKRFFKTVKDISSIGSSHLVAALISLLRLEFAICW